MDESDETSDWSDWTVIHPGISGRSDAVRCEVQLRSCDGFVLVRSNGTRSSHSLINVGLYDGMGRVCGRAGVLVGLSDAVTWIGRFSCCSGVRSGEVKPISDAALSARAFFGRAVCVLLFVRGVLIRVFSCRTPRGVQAGVRDVLGESGGLRAGLSGGVGGGDGGKRGARGMSRCGIGVVSNHMG